MDYIDNPHVGRTRIKNTEVLMYFDTIQACVYLASYTPQTGDRGGGGGVGGGGVYIF